MASSHVINMSIFASFSLSVEEAECVFIQGYILINDIKLRCFVLDPSAVLFLLPPTAPTRMETPHTDRVYGMGFPILRPARLI